MPGEKNKETTKMTKIPSKIIEAISSVYPEELSQNESCPSFSTKRLNIAETLDEAKKKKVEKEYKIGNYLIKKTLGQGTFGKVKLAIYLPNKEKVAIKILEKDRIIEKDDGIRVKREFDMLALFNHPNVILVAEIFESSDSYYSVMEYCQGGELFNYIVKNRRLSDEEASFFYFQLINGLEYLHSLGIVHRDLKPENLLLTNEHLLKIIDFGLSNYFHEGQKNLLSTPCGSPCYASPEMVAGKKYNGFKIDIWSTGIILYAMLCGYLPFEDKDNDILFEKILECKLVFPRYISKNAKDLMEKILVTDPDKRITIPEIKKHPFYLNGKNLFEQDFSIYQINKDSNEKNNSFDNIDLNNILDTPELKESNDKEKNNDNKEILDVIENNFNINEKDNIIKDNNKDNGRKIKEIEIKLNNKKQDNIDININNNNINNTRDKTELEEYNLHKKVKTYELEPNHPNIETPDKILPKDSNKENKDKNIITKEKKDLVKSINKSRSKGKNEKVKKLSLLKGTKNNERKGLIKNARKLNIRTTSKTFKTSKKLNDIINYNHFKNRLFQIKKLDIFSNIKTDNNLEKNSMNRKIKLINKQFNSKENLNQKLNLDNENIYLNSKINNNTIDDGDMNSKIKLKMNFHNLNFSSIKKNKKAKSISKNNMKLSIFEVSKLKQVKNNKNKIFRMNTSIKKNNKNKKFNLSNNLRFNNWHTIKYNLLHKKNLKEININLKKAKKIILSDEEIKKEKNTNNKLYNTNTPTIDTTLNNYNNINIIENPDNNTNKENTYIKLTKKIINKKLPKKEKYLTKTIDREKNEHHTNKTSANLNSYLQNMIAKKTKKKLSSNLITKEISKNLNINIENNNKKNQLSHFIDKSDNIDLLDNMLKTEPNQNKLIKTINQTDKKNNSSGKYLKETKKQFFQVKIPILNKNKQNKVNFIKKQKITKTINNNNKNKIPKNLNRTSNSNFHSFIQNPFIGNNPNSINKFFIHTNNGSFNQIEQNLSKKLNEKNNSNNNNLINGKKKPLVSIRNTVINFNMIDSGLILDSLKRKKKINKLNNNNAIQNNSVNKLQNNHLFGLCSKFNSNISLNSNNQLISNNDIYLSKTKTINVKNTNKKIFRYGENINNKFINKKQLDNYDKSHVKFKSMRLEDYYSIKKKKNMKNINTNKFENTINDTNKIMNIEMNHFNTINN